MTMDEINKKYAEPAFSFLNISFCLRDTTAVNDLQL